MTTALVKFCAAALCVVALAGCDRDRSLSWSAEDQASQAQFQGQPCERPVYLVVSIENLNRKKSAAYGKALRASKIVSRHGGEYLAVSPPTLLLEGEWPDDRGFVIERYPCKLALETMWNSDEYQNNIKPLRDGSGIYTVALFDKWPPSADLD